MLGKLERNTSNVNDTKKNDVKKVNTGIGWSINGNLEAKTLASVPYNTYFKPQHHVSLKSKLNL